MSAPLLTVHDLEKTFGTQHLFSGLNFSIFEEKIGLLGPNGAGKSTLLKILAGLESPDSGFITKRQRLKIGYASQAPEFPDLPLEEVLGGDSVRARILLSKAEFSDITVCASTLSGGWKKRLDICRALMDDPDLLLLDEPTNHLDLEGIEWLETFLQKEKRATLFVSHDRYFLEAVGGKMMEINKCFPQGIFVAEGNFSDYLAKKEAFLESEARREQGLASQLREEIAWLRRSPKARTTKSRSRVNAAYQLMDEHASLQNRNKQIKVDLDFSSSERETRKLLAAKNLSQSRGGKQLFKGIDLTLSPGTRLGIVGKNGTGKSTLLKTLSGELPPEAGTLKYADDLKIVYFDQHREKLPPNLSLREALSPNSDMVNYRGRPIHVNGWAKKFLFDPDRLGLPLHVLSGGERARILIARLMLEPADLLFLDEPTNDLDIPTLEVIEENLNEFPGAIVLITHDRCLMDRVCTSIIGLGDGREDTLYADFAQWETHATASKAAEEKSKAAPPKPPSKSKLLYKEKLELDAMEANILSLETEIETLKNALTSATGPSQTLALYTSLSQQEAKLASLYSRWQILLDKQASY